MDAMRRLGIGLAALGRPAYINIGRAEELPLSRTVRELRDATWSVLDAAYARGVRWVDTARSYGRAEDFLGGWLIARAPVQVTVSSKWGYTYVGDWKMDADVHEVKEHSLDRFQAQYGETRTVLGEHLSVYQVHSLTEESPFFQDVPLQAALAQISSEGVRVGFSTSGPRQAETIRRAMALKVSGQRLFSTVQSTWNVLETSAEPALREAHDAGLHVILKEVLANGKLALRPPMDVRRVAFRNHVKPDALALAAALSRPWADTVLIGAVSPSQLEANLKATEVSLDDEDLTLLAGVKVASERYWAERGALPWT
ncbi:aldo/keto reductase [Actinomadura roseirufa]|uniref:aldo/keto reductase n=1 Tax=Actinomadura roseirufa TaxID=2094049 RepID=UPI0010415D4A|nr:aldo/keto reductase [Actinomadura roseirufa]